LRIVVAPDRGLKYLSHEIASGKMQATLEGADIAHQIVPRGNRF
jgi:hypothetical protein